MKDGLNKVMLLGNVGSDPELRYTQGGAASLYFRLATHESYSDRNKETRERTEWHHVVMWGARAEGLSKVLNKGAHVLVEGSLRTSSYEREGVRHQKTEVQARDLWFMGRAVRDDDRRSPGAASAAVSAPGPMPPPTVTGRSGKNGPPMRAVAEEQMEPLPY